MEIIVLSTLFHSVSLNIFLRDFGRKSVAKKVILLYNNIAVLGGELAVPCICNPLQQNRTPPADLCLEGLRSVRDVDSKVLCNGLP